MPDDEAGEQPADPPGGRAVDVVAAMARQYRFEGVVAALPLVDLPDRTRARLERLAKAGQRLLDLDAEDFDRLAVDGVLPDPVVRLVRAAQFPRRADSDERGSLGSLIPLYALMLEALEVRWQRREPIHIVTLLHLLGEYFPLLAWESTLGHAGDPARLGAFVGVPGSRWGEQDRACDHTTAQRAAARRARSASQADEVGWESYLDRYHSRLSDALAKCGLHPDAGKPVVEGVCRTPCAVWTQLPPAVRADLGDRLRLARLYADSAVVDLRHHAPVGHFFGVPAPSEIEYAWRETREQLGRRWESGQNPWRVGSSSAGSRDAEPESLVGLGSLVSAIAGRTVGSASVFRAIRDEIATGLAEL